MKTIKKFGALVIGAIYLYDFIIIFLSNNAHHYDVIGLEVSKITYLAYLLAISVSFLTYGFTKHIEAGNTEKQTVSDSN